MNQLDLLGALLDRARAAGADSAEATVSGSISVGVQRRLGRTSISNGPSGAGWS